MQIIHVASELAPIAKVGGLADVVYGLAKAQMRKQRSVSIILPKYNFLQEAALQNLQPVHTIEVEENQKKVFVTLWAALYEGLNIFLVEPKHPQGYFERSKIYGEVDDTDRFLFFCKAASIFIQKMQPTILHLHDWPTCGCLLFVKSMCKVVLTIHNLQHQGHAAFFNLHRLGASVEKEWVDHLFPDTVNLLQGALYHSDAIVTVSPSYAKEMQKEELACGLYPDLMQNQKKLNGILNGIDTEYWNPQSDPFLAQSYCLKTMKEGKEANKAYLQKKLSLPVKESTPLFIAITRLVPQKGIALIYEGIQQVIAKGGQFVCLGSSAREEDQKKFKELAGENAVMRFCYDEPLSHLLYAAADFLFMPSLFEPCGLAQMIAMHYGTVPIVRHTGGLKDTVFPLKNGLVFTAPESKEVEKVLTQAFALFATQKWQTLRENGIKGDYSWDLSEEKYFTLYEKL